MWTKEVVDMILKGIQETLYMTLLSTLMGYVIGLPMGVLLAVSDKDGLKPNRVLYRILDVIANIVRSIPFYSYGSAAGYRRRPLHRQNGGIFLKGSR